MNLSLNDVEQLQIMIDRGVENAATLLSRMLSVTLHLETEPLRAYFLPGSWRKQLKFKAGTQLSIIELNFEGSLGGTTALLLPPVTTDSLASLLLNDTSYFLDVDAARFGVVRELGNVLINGVMSALSTALPMSLSYATPQQFRESGDSWADGLANIEAVLIVPTMFILPHYNVRRPAWIAFEIDKLQALTQLLHGSQKVH